LTKSDGGNDRRADVLLGISLFKKPKRIHQAAPKYFNLFHDIFSERPAEQGVDDGERKK
jgi:hypothetical protein